MHTADAVPAPAIPLVRPWWRRWWQAWTDRAPLEDTRYRELRDLDERTLRDIGAPAWVHERARLVERWLLDGHLR